MAGENLPAEGGAPGFRAYLPLEVASELWTERNFLSRLQRFSPLPGNGVGFSYPAPEKCRGFSLEFRWYHGFVIVRPKPIGLGRFLLRVCKYKVRRTLYELEICKTNGCFKGL